MTSLASSVGSVVELLERAAYPLFVVDRPALTAADWAPGRLVRIPPEEVQIIVPTTLPAWEVARRLLEADAT